MGFPQDKVIYYIQTQLSEGRLPDKQGYYVFTRQEMAAGSGISLSTFDSCKEDVVYYFEKWCDLKKWARYEEYAGEVLYVDVSYVRGKLKFRQNPITINSELSHLWALPPLGTYFTYDSFDEKHRRRTNSSTLEKDAIPWLWDADLYEETVRNGDNIKLLELIEKPDESSVIMQQARRAYATCEVTLLMMGYRPRTVSRVLYAAVNNTFPELCEFALQNGADPNEVIRQGYTAMSATAGLEKGGPDWERIVRMLIDAGGDLTSGNFNVCSFAGDVFSKGSDELCMYYVDALKKQGLLDYTSVTGCSPLSIATLYKGEDNPIVRMIEDSMC